MNAETSISIQQGNLELQDRAEIFRLSGRTMLAMADGAGGISGGAQTADLFMQSVREALPSLNDVDACRRLLHTIDHKLTDSPGCGETTGVIVVISAAGIYGASVGDSAAWLFTSNRKDELTRGQSRKPFLGTGVALPHGFVREMAEGTLVIATDGLWKYTSLESIEQRVRHGGEELAALVRLPSGTFQDDVAVLTCRFTCC
jgi:serine/threonine protein phosphatase PrpC